MDTLQELQDLQNQKIDEFKEKLHEINNRVTFDDNEEATEPKPRLYKTKKKTNLFEQEEEQEDEPIEKPKIKKERS